jgi:hypothetical protein
MCALVFPNQKSVTDVSQAQLVEKCLKAKGVIANAMSTAFSLDRYPSHYRETTTLLSPLDNALSLLANEWSFLRDLQRVIDGQGHVSESAAFAVHTSLVCYQTHLLDHACYRALTGRMLASYIPSSTNMSRISCGRVLRAAVAGYRDLAKSYLRQNLAVSDGRQRLRKGWSFTTSRG